MIPKKSWTSLLSQKFRVFCLFLVKLPLTLLPFMVQLSSRSIGHFAFEFDILEFERRQLQKKFPIRGRYILYFHNGRVSNSFLLHLIRQKRIVLPFLFGTLIYRMQNRFGVLGEHMFDSLKDKSAYKLVSPHENRTFLSVKYRAIDSTLSFLSSKVDITKPLVLIAIRDSGYDEFCVRKGDIDFGVLRRQAYRNTDIQEFTPAIDLLLNSGYSIIRIGRHSNSHLNGHLKNYYDYSIDTESQSDFLDVMFHYVSSFCISTGTGIDELSNLFRKRTYSVNLVPPASRAPSILNPMILLQDYFNSTNQQKLSLDHILTTNLFVLPYNFSNSWTSYFIKKKKGNEILEFVRMVISYEKALRYRKGYFDVLESKNLNHFEVSDDGRYLY